MTRQPPFPLPPLSWRSVLTLLAGIALAFGTVAPHDQALEQIGPALTPGTVVETARHPGDPVHFEASSSQVHHACVACLLQAESRGHTAGLSASAQPSLAWDVRIAPLAERPSSPGLRRAGPPRAPPFLSPAA